jgi:hypothetical protein
MKCRDCKSEFTKYDKWIFGSPSNPSYHYRGYCKKCKKYIYLERTKEIYDIVLPMEWKKSKAYKKAQNDFTLC